MIARRTLIGLVASLPVVLSLPAGAQSGYTAAEIVNTGNAFFGDVSGGLATVVEKAFADYGQPSGYILGQEGGGAVVGGVRYGEGELHLQGDSLRRVYWQGPSVGIDFGADGARTMILIYNLVSADDLYRRFVGVDGSAYFIGGFGLTALQAGDVVLVPVRSGVGARLGLNIGYLKMTAEPTWNPF